MNKQKKPIRDIKVTHIMKDGSVRDTLDGYIIEVEDLPFVARKILTDMMAPK